MADYFFDAITDEQVAKVRQHVSNSTEKPDDELSKGGANTAKTGTQHAGEDIDDEFEALNQATAVRADGGKPTT
jgi:hypothetical protein